jgi:D-glutamate cyclase
VIASGAVLRARATHDLIDQILALDPGRRGIETLIRPGAALAAARALRRARVVLIVTGFTVKPDTPETDGPPGAAVLGRALRTLGSRVRYVTDRANTPIVTAALTALGEPPDLVVSSDGEDSAREVLLAERPTHLVAIERPGRNRAGDYLSMRGESVAAWNAPLDALFMTRRGETALRPVTIGVGDGGNEIGMGVVHARLRRLGPLATRIASVVRVDHLVVAGVSNWGGYGVVAALSRLARRDLLHTPELERRLVEVCVAAGASDGVTRRREPTVDGLPIEVHAAVVELLRLAARSGIIPA